MFGIEQINVFLHKKQEFSLKRARTPVFCIAHTEGRGERDQGWSYHMEALEQNTPQIQRDRAQYTGRDHDVSR